MSTLFSVALLIRQINIKYLAFLTNDQFFLRSQNIDIHITIHTHVKNTLFLAVPYCHKGILCTLISSPFNRFKCKQVSGCAFNNTFSLIWDLGLFWYAHMEGLILDHEQQTSRKRRPPPYVVGLRLFCLFPLS